MNATVCGCKKPVRVDATAIHRAVVPLIERENPRIPILPQEQLEWLERTLETVRQQNDETEIFDSSFLNLNLDCNDLGNLTSQGSEGIASLLPRVENLNSVSPSAMDVDGQETEQESSDEEQHQPSGSKKVRGRPKKDKRCRICGTEISRFGLLAKHMELEHTFQCSNCVLKFVDQKQLTRHKQDNHPDLVLRCPEPGCDICFANQITLKKHMQRSHQ